MQTRSKIFILISLILLLSASSILSFGQTIIWLEDFAGLANGTKVDGPPTAWTIDDSGCGNVPPGLFEVQSNYFQGTDTHGEGVWYSEVVDISSYTDVKITVDLATAGLLADANDYIRVY